MLKFVNQSIRKELAIFNKLYRKALNTKVNDFKILLDHILNKKGKQIRPILLILSAKLCGTPTYETFRYAVILELLHVSTLIHDDVVDNSTIRRGTKSIMAKFGNKTAVLLGDYIISNAIGLSVKTKNLNFLQVMSQLSKNLSEGELTQMISSSMIIVEEDHYFEIIKKKTAVFFSTCLDVGALSVHASSKKRKILQTIGEYMGICFQIKDDLLDFSKSEKIGKPTNHDFLEGKITLPLIYALKKAPKEQYDIIVKLLKKQDFSTENVKKLFSFVKEKEGIIYAQKKMIDIKKKIIELLDYFPFSDIRYSISTLIDYIIERTD